MTIINRLLKLKGSRSVLQWEREAGIARGNLDRAIKDGKLSDENLRKLCRWENARADWLLFGSGSPYQIAGFSTDHDLAERICAHHTDAAADWSLTVIYRESDQLPMAVVMTMPGQYPGKDESMIDYTILEVLLGQIGPYTCEAIKRDSWRRRQQIMLDDEVVKKLFDGNIGTYALTADPNYLKAAVPLDDKTLTELASNITESPGSYTVPLTPPEQRLLNTYRALPGDDRNRLLAIAATLKEFSQ
jgi:hypothetical protein